MKKAHAHNVLFTYHRSIGASEKWTIAVKSQASPHSAVYVTQIKYTPSMKVLFPRLHQEIGLCSLLELLGMNRSTFRSLLSEEERVVLKATLDDPTETILLKNTFMLGKNKSIRIQHAFQFLLPHQKKNKALYLVIMAKSMVSAIRDKRVTDKDCLSNIRIEMVADLMSSITLQLLKRMSNELRLNMQKNLRSTVPASELSDKFIMTILRRNTISDGLSYALGTGNWDTRNVDTRRKVGVSQLLQRSTRLTTISQLRRLSSSVNKDQKLTAPREQHPSSYGYICPAETPEGAPVGLELQLALTASMSLPSDTAVIDQIVKSYITEILSLDGCLVYVNGAFIGNTSNDVAGTQLVHHLRRCRRNGQLNHDVSIAVTLTNDIQIRTTAGRLCRPLRIVTNSQVMESKDGISYTEMLVTGIVELLDIYECRNALIAFRSEDITEHTTHMEIHPGVMFGIAAATVPLLNHNPSPRVTYQIAMCKQAQSIPNLNYNTTNAIRTSSNILHYPQRPIVSTLFNKMYNIDDLPSGMNAIVAVLPWKSTNQEDGIAINKASIERGMFVSTRLHSQTCSLSASNGEKFVLKKPSNSKICNMSHITEDGLPIKHHVVQKGDMLIGRVRFVTEYRGSDRLTTEVDSSVYANKPGIIHRVLLCNGRDGATNVIVEMRHLQIPQLGDKFASRSAQKGSLSCIVPQEDLPFSARDGLVPDLLINPHSFPSRMTAAQLMESLMSKCSLYSNKFTDGTVFNNIDINNVSAVLKKCGYNHKGNESMICGITGKMFKVQIFIGSTYYQRLKHNAYDKMYARGALGSTDSITRQPSEGRMNNGGLRFGEMETWCLTSHGVPHLIEDTLKTRSDPYKLSVCSFCGDNSGLADANTSCSRCGVSATTKDEYSVPYAFNLLRNELRSMCVDTRIRISD